MLRALTECLLQKRDLSDDDVGDAVTALVDGSVATETKAEFLAALAQKRETVAEITAFVRELRGLAIKPELGHDLRGHEILDVCGTGGDRLNTFNISTTVALVAAAAGAVVAKHGNRAITSKSGSADVLEALGIKIDLSPEAAVDSLRRHHFAFFLAPQYHPAFKQIAPARKLCAERGLRTIFNFVGPLLNPVLPTAQLVGVPHPDLCIPVARVLQSLGARRGIVVCGTVPQPGGRAYLDEFSTLGESVIAEFHHPAGFHDSVMPSGNFPLQPAVLSDLAGGDAASNAMIIRRILAGEERGPKRDAVLLNTAAALFVSGQCEDLVDGWERAGDLIDSGKASAKLRELSRIPA